MVHCGLNKPVVETAHAILKLGDNYVLQLRDDSPLVASAGQWSLFGGKIDKGETPQDAMQREIFEELSIKPDTLKLLWPVDYHYEFAKGMVRTWFFEAQVDSVWEKHKLNEGRAAKAYTFEGLSGLDIPDIIRKVLNRYHAERELQ